MSRSDEAMVCLLSLWSVHAKANTQHRYATRIVRWMTPIHSLKAFGAIGGFVGPTDITMTNAAAIVPAARVHNRSDLHLGSWRKRRRNTKVLTGDSENTSAPKRLRSLPNGLSWAAGVAAGSIVK